MEFLKVEAYLRSRYGWSQAKIQRVKREYLEFLEVAAASVVDLDVPSTEIDDMWHAHILHTEQYAADCVSKFGHVIHHRPEIATEDEPRPPARCKRPRPVSRCKSPEASAA